MGNQNKSSNWRGKIMAFVMGVLATVLILGVAAPALAEVNDMPVLQDIRVAMGNIKIYVDGVLQKPTDVNGNEVQPMIYDGTTYLPVRALTGMLTDKEVNWDQSTYSVYIGNVPNKPLVGLEDVTQIKYEVNETRQIKTGNDAKFTVLEK